MNYYEVLVVQEYTSLKSVFTYAHEADIAPFSFVTAPLQKKLASGIVVKKVPRPSFETKEIARVFTSGLNPTQRFVIRFMQSYYAANEAQILPLFIPSFLAKVEKLSDQEPRTKNKEPSNLPPLTHDQTTALKTLRDHDDETVVLHGDTGTGKTRLYIERAKDVLATGKSVLILSPEIALVPQLQKVLEGQFGDRVMSYHSGLTDTQRAKAWAAAQDGGVVIIGTRSALFLPLQNLGLIVVDESHEPAYKQEEGVRYHATRIASVIASHQKAQLILASATPLVADMYLAKEKKRTVIRMLTPAIKSKSAVSGTIIDMKDRAEFSMHPMLSSTLLHAIETALQNGEQSLVYLNRRGTARAILCQDCGWQAMCPTCDVSLTYHHDDHTLRCHTCGYKTSVPNVCPTCKSSEILFKSAGTKAIAEWLSKHFPQAKVARFDTDNLKAESLHERHAEVADGSIDILVGTQMLVKGLDLPNLSVVGIIAADLSLQIPDFSAEERTFQLLCQAVGRVGRGHRNGTTIVQTFNPQNDVISQALAKDYEAFYTTQIEQRFSYAYSPAVQLATFWCSKKSADAALRDADKIKHILLKKSPETEILGPVITFHPKKRGHASAQLVVKTTARSTLNELALLLPNGWQYDLEPTHLL